MRVTLYARVSTVRQAERDLSIPDQVRQLRLYCERGDHHVVREFREEGASATDDARSVFREMVEYVLDRSNRIDAILVLTTSRFFRDAVGARVYKRRLKRAGVRVISITQEVKDDPSGTLVEGIFEGLDQYESEIIGYHALRGMKENARRGYWNGSPPPFGYRLEPTTDARGNEKSRLAIDEQEAEIVRTMFSLYCSGLDGRPMGLKRLLAHLNSEGLLRRGNPWTRESIARRLRDPVYTGDYYFNKTEGRTGTPKPQDERIHVAVPAIISRELFERTLEVRRARRPNAKTNPAVSASPWLLTGLLYCGRCGARMSAEVARRKYRYYNCSAYLRNGKATCPGNRVQRAALEHAVLQCLRECVITPDRLRDIIGELIQESARARQRREVRTGGLEAKLDSVRGRRRRYHDAFETGALQPELLKERLEELAGEEERLLHERRATAVPAQLPVHLQRPDNVDRVIAHMRRLCLSSDAQHTKAYIEQVIDRITLQGTIVTIEGGLASALGMSFPQPSVHGSPSPHGCKRFVETFRLSA